MMIFYSGSFDLHLLRAEDALVCRCQSDARASSATTFAATWQGDTIEEWPIFTDMLSYLPDVCINAEIVVVMCG